MLVDEVDAALEGDGGADPASTWALARSRADAPEIDGAVRVPMGEWDLAPGDLVEVDIVGSDEHDLVGRVPEE